MPGVAALDSFVCPLVGFGVSGSIATGGLHVIAAKIRFAERGTLIPRLPYTISSTKSLDILGLPLLLRLLPSQRHLSGHHPLSFGDQRALGAHTVLPSTVTFVS
jgi:hypothetical protein